MEVLRGLPLKFLTGYEKSVVGQYFLLLCCTFVKC